MWLCRLFFTSLLALLSCYFPLPGLAHDGLSVHDAASRLLERLRSSDTPPALGSKDTGALLRLLQPDERRAFAENHVYFRSSQPVEVQLAFDVKVEQEAFWLKEAGFAPGRKVAQYAGRGFRVWKKSYPAGEVRLGVNSFSGRGFHYLVGLRPLTQGSPVTISESYPAGLQLVECAPGQRPYRDIEYALESCPAGLSGTQIVQVASESRRDARVLDVLRSTVFPAGDFPDQLVMTWAGDPQTTQSLQWRSSEQANWGKVRLERLDDDGRVLETRTLNAERSLLVDDDLVNDTRVARYSQALSALKPGTKYRYSIGRSDGSGWARPGEFSTAPAQPESFSFVYMGDAQNGLDQWGKLAVTAVREEPEARFYIMAGDLVDRGNERDDWDNLFGYGAQMFGHRPLVPVIGNHEVHGGNPDLYLKLFDLPKNGPAGIAPERAYHFTYGNALFVILDSNLEPASQAEWLDQVLAQSDAKWKFAVYHHPAYSAKPERSHKGVRKHWVPIFDRHKVDVVMQGHDHSYLRTFPLKDGKQVSEGEGTVYVLSVSGTKMYEQAPGDYAEFTLENTATYQTLDIRIEQDRLIYHAYDGNARLVDSFEIRKDTGR
ncbi:purple acid phosphatase family protein [Biformimicrobium ophioploci]|uniref:Alkaline phosphatase n=1 Tax=Biformimicrobium ophioploci TaxID=3036711 RepID=A0ABQ6LY08_9GAMM|nr:metallophosphoesterase family protein [Microbulbifer sp. NKW57]GMG86926.1 hypothetical protein MNKW57_12470 [Microbulbifer sp. NKW57]